MIKNIGIFEVKTHLSEILRNGEDVCITNRGKKIAFIIAANKFDQSNNIEIFEKFNNLKKLRPLGDVNEIIAMKELGRK